MSIPTDDNPPHVHEVMNNKNPSHVHTMDTNIDPKHSYWHNLAEEFSRDINTQHDKFYLTPEQQRESLEQHNRSAGCIPMPTMQSPYELLSARLHALEAELAAMREQLKEIKDVLQETWMGGTD